jgi:hypothetical protein
VAAVPSGPNWTPPPIKSIKKLIKILLNEIENYYQSNVTVRSRDNEVGIATDYGLDDRGVAVRVPISQEEFSLFHVVQTGSGVHRSSYSMGTGTGTGGSFPGVKRPGHEDDHSYPAIAEVKKKWIHTSAPPYAFMA